MATCSSAEKTVVRLWPVNMGERALLGSWGMFLSFYFNVWGLLGSALILALWSFTGRFGRRRK